MTERLIALVVAIARDLPGLAGAASLLYGIWLIYPPAMFIVSGLSTIALMAAVARRRAIAEIRARRR